MIDIISFDQRVLSDEVPNLSSSPHVHALRVKIAIPFPGEVLVVTRQTYDAFEETQKSETQREFNLFPTRKKYRIMQMPVCGFRVKTQTYTRSHMRLNPVVLSFFKKININRQLPVYFPLKNNSLFK